MRVVVIGAGVVGLGCAYELVKDGHEVVVLDSGTPGAGVSHGNAAKIAVAEASPVPAPGMVVQGLKWMLRRDSPLYIRPTLSPAAVRFMTQMARACTESQFRHGLQVNLALATRSVDLFDEWTDEGLTFETHERGTLIAYESAKALQARQRYGDVFERFGVESELLDADGVHRVEPTLSERIQCGLYYPRDRQVEPDSLTAALTERARQLGVTIHEHSAVTAFERGASGVTAVRTATDRFIADKVVLAAGVWSAPLAERLGSFLPIRPGKGYSVDFPSPPLRLGTSLTFDDAHVAVTPLNGFFRLAGTMEFGGFDEALNMRRVNAIIQAAVDGLTDWHHGLEHRTPWAGLRSMTPDGLAVIGGLPGVPNVLVAAGHAMLGLTLAPITGRLVRDLVGARPTDPLLAAVSPNRFARRRRGWGSSATMQDVGRAGQHRFTGPAFATQAVPGGSRR